MNTNNLGGPIIRKHLVYPVTEGSKKHTHTNTPLYPLCRDSFPKEFPLRKGLHPTKRKQKDHLSCAAPSKAYWISTQFFPLLVENMFPICLTNEPWGPALPSLSPVNIPIDVAAQMAKEMALKLGGLSVVVSTRFNFTPIWPFFLHPIGCPFFLAVRWLNVCRKPG